MAFDPTKHYQAKWQALQDALQKESEARSAFHALAGANGQLEGVVDNDIQKDRDVVFAAMRGFKPEGSLSSKMPVDAMVLKSGIEDAYNTFEFRHLGGSGQSAENYRKSEVGSAKFKNPRHDGANDSILGQMDQRHSQAMAELAKKANNGAPDVRAKAEKDMAAAQANHDIKSQLFNFRRADHDANLIDQQLSSQQNRKHVPSSAASAPAELNRLKDRLLDAPVTEALALARLDRYGRETKGPAAAVNEEFFNPTEERSSVLLSKMDGYAKAVGKKRLIEESRQVWEASLDKVEMAKLSVVDLMRQGDRPNVGQIPALDGKQVQLFASLNPANDQDRAALEGVAASQSVGAPAQLPLALSMAAANANANANATQPAVGSQPAVASQSAIALPSTASQSANQTNSSSPSIGAVSNQLELADEFSKPRKGPISSANMTIAEQAERDERLKFIATQGLTIQSSQSDYESANARFKAHWAANGPQLTADHAAKEAAAAAAKEAAAAAAKEAAAKKIEAPKEAATSGAAVGPSKPTRGRGY